MIVPKRFTEQIWLHLARLDLYDSAYKNLSTPLILCIEGRPGVGKSSQLQHYLTQLGCYVERLDASSFGGMYENEPVRIIEERLELLSDSFEPECPRPCLIVDDFDMSLGRLSSSTSYTVNTQLTTGWFMSYADKVISGDFGSHTPAIFVTGNDLSNIHKPLLRTGRAKRFTYEPTVDELYDIILPILAPFSCESIAQEISRMPHITLSTILEAISTCIDKETLAHYGELPPNGKSRRAKIKNSDLMISINELASYEIYLKGDIDAN